jgi:hypothetical protein
MLLGMIPHSQTHWQWKQSLSTAWFPLLFLMTMMMLSSMVHSFAVPVAGAASLQTSNQGNIRQRALTLFQQPQRQPLSDHKLTANVLPSASFHATLMLHVPTL